MPTLATLERRQREATYTPIRKANGLRGELEGLCEKALKQLIPNQGLDILKVRDTREFSVSPTPGAHPQGEAPLRGDMNKCARGEHAEILHHFECASAKMLRLFESADRAQRTSKHVPPYTRVQGSITRLSNVSLSLLFITLTPKWFLLPWGRRPDRR